LIGRIQLAALSLQLDRKLKLFVPPKMLIALKHLRTNLDAILSIKMRGKEISKEQEEWWDLALEVVGREKATGEDLIAAAAGVVQ
jgi:ATP-dependent RNA helicase DHX29